MLRNSFSIVLSISILLQGLNLHLSDMIEMQIFMKHLKEHQISYGDDLMTFFDKHYGELRDEHEREEHKGSDEHEKLPFKHKVCQVNSGTMINNHDSPERSMIPVPILTNPNFHYLNNYSFLNPSDIFQPPKLL